MNARQAVAAASRRESPSEIEASSAATGKSGTCPSCGSLTETSAADLFDTRFGIAGTFEVGRCPHCGLEHLSPRPSAAELKILYERYYNFSGEHGTLYTRFRERFFSSRLYRAWIRIDGDISFHTRRGTGRLLDIGCNEGRTLKNYKRNGFQAEGLELNERAAEIARAAGFTVFTQPLDEFAPASPYGVVVLSNVLEHALDPAAMLQSARRLLAPRGQLWISCPNSQSMMRPLFGGWWINWHVPFHITHFSSGALRTLLKNEGYEAIAVRQITPALWVASSIVARLFARPGQPTRQLRNPLLMAALVFSIRAFLFPLLYYTNRCGRGDCLVVTAERSQ